MMRSKIFYMFVLSCTTSVVTGQSIYNSTSIFVPSSITVYANGVDNNGFILNNGTIEATGNWSNESVYQGLGTIALTGTDQSIDNNDQSVEHLLITGGGSKEVNGKLTINGSIEFASGIVKVGNHDNLLVRDDADVEGGSTTSFVDGPLQIEGTGFKFFPIGSAGSYYPVTLTDIRGFNTTVELEAIQNLPDVATPEKVNIDREVYWTIKTVDGTFTGSPISAPFTINPDETDGIVFVTANDLDEEFDIIATEDLQTSGGMSFATSTGLIKKSIFAVGGLPEKPIIPGYLSTTLSPNASNPDNRLIKMLGVDVRPDNFRLQVINRWGNVVFESTSFDRMSTDGWDGKSGGQLLPAGAYPYMLTYVNRKGKESSARGFITIIY